MELRPLGRTGVQVSKLCLGTMMFGDWDTKDQDESIKTIHQTLDAGINFAMTAAGCLYTQETGEDPRGWPQPHGQDRRPTHPCQGYPRRPRPDRSRHDQAAQQRDEHAVGGKPFGFTLSSG